MAILHPQATPQITPFDSLTKGELAQIVNRQTKELQALTRDKGQIMGLLCAIVRHPDGFRVNARGEAEIDIEAIEILKENTQLTTHRTGDTLELKVRESAYLLHAESFQVGATVSDLH